MTDWTPAVGELGMVRCSDGEWRMAQVHEVDNEFEVMWFFEDGSARFVHTSEARPLPEPPIHDPEALERWLNEE